MDLTQYLPFYWTVIANRWTASSSRTYLREFGVGVVEWRVLATLAAHEQATAQDSAKLTGMDIAAASRAMKALLDKVLVEPVSGRFVGRNKPFRMTPEGRTLVEQIGDVARRRVDLLLQDLSQEEQATLLDLLQRVHARLPEINEG